LVHGFDCAFILATRIDLGDRFDTVLCSSYLAIRLGMLYARKAEAIDFI
jgi:hypothetical protein